MKNRIFLRMFVLTLTVLMLLPVTVAAAKYPKPENFVADDADILSESVINMIRDTNRDLLKDYGMTIAVCTVGTVGGVDIATYAQELYKEWKLGEGVLIVIAKDDKNYYFIPSVGVQDILTNEDFTSVRDNYFEADFNNGSYENAIYKSVPKFENLMISGIQNKKAEEKKAEQAEAEANGETEGENAEEKGTTVGSVITGFFKFLLWAAIIVAVLIILLFVGALFNDDLAVIFRKYILRKNDDVRPISTPDFYDERLYGGRPNPNNGQRGRPQEQNQRRPNPNGYPQNGNYPNNPYGYNNQPRGYLGDGRNNRPNPNYNPNNGYSYNHPQGYPQNNGPYGNRPMNGNYGNGQYPQNRPMNGGNPNYNPQNSGRPANGNGSYNNYNNNYNNPNRNNRPGYGNPQNAGANNNDATVQFNIPRRN